MKTKPILFSTDMVQANLSGAKTMTRRVINEMHFGFLEHAFHHKKNITDWIIRTSKYQPGDILWVRETFQKLEMIKSGQAAFLYKADIDLFNPDIILWSPSIHMPKEAARCFLKILSVRVERLQDISEADAIAEGIPTTTFKGDILKPISAFYSYWMELYGFKSWEANPYVWVYEYEKIEKPENFLQ